MNQKSLVHGAWQVPVLCLLAAIFWPDFRLASNAFGLLCLLAAPLMAFGLTWD